MDPPAPRPSLVERLTSGARSSLHAWHGEFREEIGKITANPRKRAIAAGVAAAVLLGIGVAGWIGLGKQSPIASSQAAPAHPAQPKIARLSARLTVSDTIERLALALPSEAALASVEVDKDGGFAVEVELPDPERLRAALAADSALRGLRQVSQMSGDNGPRVRLFAPATPAGNGVVNALAAGDRLVQKLRRTAARTGTLIEAAEPLGPPPAALIRVAASGREKALLAFVGEIETGAPPIRFAHWRIEPSRAADGAMRLEGAVAGIRQPSPRLRIPTTRRLDVALNRPLFIEPSIAPAPYEDLLPPPELVGIVGRLPDAAVALVRTPEGGARTLGLGDSHEGWRLAALAPDAAFFTRGSERMRVALPAQ
jgi:hypothetical protein